MILDNDLEICNVEHCREDHEQEVGERIEQLEGMFEKLDAQAERLEQELS